MLDLPADEMRAATRADCVGTKAAGSGKRAVSLRDIASAATSRALQFYPGHPTVDVDAAPGQLLTCETPQPLTVLPVRRTWTSMPAPGTTVP
jgi:hypothetical protein